MDAERSWCYFRLRARYTHTETFRLRQALQDQVAALQKDNQHLRHFIEEKIPTRARDIIQVCSSGAGAHVDVPSHGDLVDQDLTLMQVLACLGSCASVVCAF